MKGCAAPECERPASSRGYCRMHAERIRRFGHPGRNPRPRKPASERLWAKVDKSGGPDACWTFTGKLTLGYGQIRLGGQGSKTTGAHRLAWMLANPDAPAPEMLDHVCHDPKTCHLAADCPHRSCCNPAHLVPATAAENSSPERRWGNKPSHCKWGHEFTPENTYIVGDNKARRCRACDARRHAERKAAAA